MQHDRILGSDPYLCTTPSPADRKCVPDRQSFCRASYTDGLQKPPTGAIPKCGHVALVLDCYYVDICVIFSSSGSLRMRLISQFSRASGARFSETDDSPETVVGRWILPAKLKALLGSSAILSQVVPGKDLMAESKSPLFGIAPGVVSGLQDHGESCSGSCR